MQSIYEQLFAFLSTIGIGFLAGIIFDIYRVLRGLWRPRKIGTFIGDLVFWLVMTVIVFTLLLLGNWGEIRIYVFIGVGLGIYLYIRFLSKRWQKMIRRVFIFMIKILNIFWKIVTWPIKMLWKIILVPVGLVFSGVGFMVNFVQKGLKRIGRKLASLRPAKKDEPEDIE